jgi:hypothetical protein
MIVLSRRSLLWRIAVGGGALVLPGACRPERHAGAEAAPGLGRAEDSGTLNSFPEIERVGLEAQLSGDRLLLTGQLSAAEGERLGMPPLEATFVTAVELYSQRPLCRRVSPGSVVQVHGPTATGGSTRFRAAISLASLLPELGTSQAYLIHASLLAHQSGVCLHRPGV